MKEEIKLKFCPFCGNKVSVYDCGNTDGFYIACDFCECSIGYDRDEDGFTIGYFKTEQQAAEEWNKRYESHT